MSGSRGDISAQPSPSANGGEFLLQLLRNSTPPQQPPLAPLPAQILSHDPAVAAVGSTVRFPPFPSNCHYLPHQQPPRPHSPPFAPHFFQQLFPPNPSPNPNPNHNWSPPPALPADFSGNHHHNFQYNNTKFLADDIRQKEGALSSTPRPDSAHQHDQKLMFGSFSSVIQSSESVKARETVERNMRSNGFEANSPNFSQNPADSSHSLWNKERERRSSGGGGWGRQQQSGPSQGVRRPPPGFPRKPNNYGNWDSGNKSFEHYVDKGKSGFGELSHRSHMGSISSHGHGRGEKLLHEQGNNRGDSKVVEWRLSSQRDCSGPPSRSSLHSVSASDIEESLSALHFEAGKNREKPVYRFQEDMGRGGFPVGSVLDDGLVEEFGSLALEDGSDKKNNRKGHQSSRDKDHRSDTRGQRLLGQRERNFKSRIACRNDISRLNVPFLAIYESLIPPEEEKGKQKQLMTFLEKLVSKEWPEARLYLYGSCANSFGVSKSDIDVCLAIEDPDVNKPEVLVKLAEILESNNLQNVQALIRARVPIVKVMDPATGLSCDICINNVLAVVNTKLLRDYAKIDARLRQLGFIVKRWAKLRGVNETYHGTLSSYAYVLMCIHFLQHRRPAILPCLQGMERTYAITIENIECAYFDQVEKLTGFGSHNRENIAQLVWAFFNYWAYCHDYAHDVISIRTGSVLSKGAKNWTRRVGNDRHLICIEDPFETSHDLGRVVDKNSIRVLREEFERAAEIMQNDPNPCVTLFEPYVSVSS